MTVLTQPLTSTKPVLWYLSKKQSLCVDGWHGCRILFPIFCFFMMVFKANNHEQTALFQEDWKRFVAAIQKIRKNYLGNELMFQSPEYCKVVRAISGLLGLVFLYSFAAAFTMYILKLFRDQYMPMLLFQEERLATFLSWKQEKRW